MSVLKRVVAVVGAVAVAGLPTSAFGWECATGMIQEPPVFTGHLADRAACANPTVACTALADARPSAPPAEALAGLRFACTSPIADGTPSALTAAFADRLEVGEAVSWSPDTGLARGVDLDSGKATAACLRGAGCDEVRGPAGLLEALDARPSWGRSRSGVVETLVAVEHGPDGGCVAVSLFPRVPTQTPRLVDAAKPALGHPLP